MNFVGISEIQRQVMRLSGDYEQDLPSPVTPISPVKNSRFVFPAGDQSRNSHQTDVAEVRMWITMKSGVKCQTDDAILLKFLRNCNFDVSKAKRRVSGFYAVRASVADWFQMNKQDFAKPNVQSIFRSGVFVPCHYDLFGRRIIVCRLGCFSPRQGKLEDLIKLIVFVAQHVLVNEQTLTFGVVVIMDFKGFGVRDVTQYTPNLIKKIVTLIQDSIPCRLKALHMLNAPTFVPSFLKSFLSNKMKTRFHVHGAKPDSEFYGFIPRGCLPMEYGGTQGKLQQFIDAIEVGILSGRDVVAEDEDVFTFDSNESQKLL